MAASVQRAAPAPVPQVADAGRVQGGAPRQTAAPGGGIAGATRRADTTHSASASCLDRAGTLHHPGLRPESLDLIWSEGALYNIGIENALRICHGLLRPGGYLAFTDAVWRRENPPPEVRASFDLDYPTMGRVPDVVAAIGKTGFSLVDHFTLPDEAWWDDFYTPMERRIEELRSKFAGDAEAPGVLDQLAQEPEMHRRNSGYYAYEFFVVHRT